MLKQAWAIALKDFQVEYGKKTLSTSLIFLSIQLIFLSSFVVAKYPDIKQEIGTLTIWLVLIYLLFQALNRSLALEDESGCWDALRLCPISPKVIFMGKLFFNSILLICVQLFIFPFFLLFFNLGKSAWVMLLPIILTSFGFISVGLLIALLSLKNQGRDLLANIMSLPLFLPALFLGIRITVEMSGGAEFNRVLQGLAYLAAYDSLSVAVSFFAFDTDLAE